MIRPFRAGDETPWDAFVRARPEGHSCHLLAWKRIIEEAFGHATQYLVAEGEAGAFRGILPLVRLKSLCFGDFLVSMPYLNYGGPCADGIDVARGLLAEARAIARRLGVRHVEIRTETDTDFGMRIKSAKVSMRLDLTPDPEALWRRFPAKLRSQVKRACQEKMSVRVGGAEELDSFYEVFARNMRDLGTPVYAKRFFGKVLEHLPGATWICTVYLGDRAVAAGFLVGFRDTLEIPWASSLREYNRLSPNMLLYWSALEHGCRQGFRVFDFGRSSPDSGPYRFKQQWGATPVALHWHYWLRDGGGLPDLTPTNPHLRAAISVWRRLPVVLTKVIGPPIVRRLP